MKKTLSVLLAFVLALSAFPALAGEAAQYGYTNTEAALYINASTKAALVTKLGEGVKVEVLGFTETDSGDNFFEVKALKGGDTGYVLESELDLVITRQEASIPKPSQDFTPLKGEKVTDESAYPVLTASGLVDILSELSEEDLAKYAPIKVGDKGDNVLALKKRMYELGYFKNLSTNNEYSKNTASYVEEFQKKNGLPVTGEADSYTLAVFYSDTALGKEGKSSASAGLEITRGQVERYEGSTAALFSLKNNGSVPIDAFNIYVVPYSAYGNRISYTESLMEEMELLTFSNEDNTIKAGSTLSYNKNGYVISVGQYYGGAMACICSYHTTDGETHEVPDDQRVWFGVGKGVTEGAVPLQVTSLTQGEKALADEWNIGVKSVYVDAEYAQLYSLRQGSFVRTVDPGSPADKAGLEAGDIILAIGDLRIFGSTTLARARSRMAKGDSALMLYWRNGEVFATTLTRPGDAVNSTTSL